jgi:hypothetical protein
VKDYCDAPAELEKNTKVREWCNAVAIGDANVFEFCWVIWNFEHVYDDLVDGDVEVVQEDAAKALADLFRVLTFNPFYQAYKAQLFALMISAVERWVEADRMDDKAEASVVRCGDLDLFMQVAYLHGGWDHMRAMRELRSFDPPDEKEA